MRLPYPLTQRYILALLTAMYASSGLALDPEPRKWGHLPLGTNFAGIGYATTKADILFDPALRLLDVEMQLNTVAGSYIRPFKFLNKSARISITQAYQEGRWTGLLDGVAASTTRSGLSDTLVRFAVNLHGAPPLSGKKYASYRANIKKETIIGTALTVHLPTGDYRKDKLINLSQNRFTFRPQIGLMHTQGKWITELTGEVAFFSDNNEFFNGNRLKQKPLYIVYTHLTRNFSPGHWLSVSAGYDYGGESSINGVDSDDKKQNVGWKLSYALPLNRSKGLKFSYVGTRTNELTGFDSGTLAASISFLW